MVTGTELPPSDPGPAAGVTTCPQCSAQVPVDPRYSPWCDACDWNVAPDDVPAPGGLRGMLDRRSDAATQAVLDRVLRVGPTADRRVAVLAGLYAVPVHLVTLGLAVAAVALALSDVWLVARVVGVLLLLGVLWQVVPRPGRLDPHAVPVGADRLPETFRVVEEVARAVGARPPHDVVVDACTANASYEYVGLRRRRVLTIGLPLWNVLDPGARVALLGHELGHDVNRDVRRMLVVGTALETLGRWARLADPRDVGSGPFDPYHSDAAAPEFYSGEAGMVRIAERMTRGFFTVLYAVVLLVGSGLYRLAARAGQVAEYRADLTGVAVGGREASVRCLTAALLDAQVGQAFRTAVNAGVPDVWQAQRDAFVAVDPREAERARRRAARTLQRVDDWHPPTHLRLELVRAQPDASATVWFDRHVMDRVDAELLRLAPRTLG